MRQKEGARMGCPAVSPPPPPYPDSGRKFLVFNQMRKGLRSKFVILLEFAAESSWQRGSGRYAGLDEPRVRGELFLADPLLKIVQQRGVIICKGRNHFLGKIGSRPRWSPTLAIEKIARMGAPGSSALVNPIERGRPTAWLASIRH